MSFILDALRKSEHERQRSTAPGLSHVPLATPRRELPPWALLVMGVLGVAVLMLGVAWWQSARSPAAAVVASAPVERNLDLPLPPPVNTTPTPASPAPGPAVPRLAVPAARPLSQATAAAEAREESLAGAAVPASAGPVSTAAPAAGGPTLPSAAALMAEGIALPELRLELHAFSAQPSDRFVFINGRKYVEGERLADGPELVSIEPNGAVLRQQGRRFLLTPE